MTIEIEGIKYQEKEHPQARSGGLIGGRLSMIRMAAAMIASSIGTNDGSQDSALYTIELIEEYKLIQQKKSNLSANQRRQVVHRFERMFTKIE